jgi:copper chaperone
MKEINVAIHGMSCGGCVNKVTAALKSLPGVTVEKVKVGSATVLINPAQIASSQLIEAISAAGFTAEELPASNKAQQVQ